MPKNVFLLLTLLSAPLAAQFSGPSLGLIFDGPNQALRRIGGMPGAAVLGEPLLSNVVSAAIAPDHTFAVFNDGANRLYSSAGIANLPDGIPAPARAVFSPRGGSAAFYRTGSASITVATGLPGSPALQTTALSDAAVQFAVNDAGALLVSTPRDGAGETVLWISPGGPPVRLLDVTQTGAIVFSPDGFSAWIADSADNSVWQVSQLDSVPAVTRVADTTAGIATPVALAVSPDGKQLWIANGGTSAITALDLQNDAVLSSTFCSCKPRTLAPLAGTGIFRLTDLADGPVWIFDVSGIAPRTLFIPALAAQAGASL